MKTCLDCSASLSAKNVSGRCRPCLARHVNADPEIQARKRAAIQAKFDEPGRRQEYAERMARLSKSFWNDEDYARRRRIDGVRNAPRTVMGDACQAASMAPETIAKRGAGVSEAALSWCPPHLREEYRRLNRSKGIPAAQAREMVLEDARREASRQIEAFNRAQRERAAREKAQAY